MQTRRCGIDAGAAAEGSSISRICLPSTVPPAHLVHHARHIRRHPAAGPLRCICAEAACSAQGSMQQSCLTKDCAGPVTFDECKHRAGGCMLAHSWLAAARLPAWLAGSCTHASLAARCSPKEQASWDIHCFHRFSHLVRMQALLTVHGASSILLPHLAPCRARRASSQRTVAGLHGRCPPQ